MASSNTNTSAILDVITESKEVPTISKELKEYDSSISCNSCSTYENSLVVSPSLESFSTLQDVEALSELNMEQNSDMHIRVDNPQKHLDTLETYITFRITTKVARIEFEQNEYIVRRRYNDFMWLRHKLIEEYPFCIIPPLPAKHTLMGQLDRYSKEFILVRMKSLQIFMTRLVDHPILSCSKYFKIFITANQLDFALHLKQKNNSHRSREINHNTLPVRTIKNRNVEFEKAKDYLTLLAAKITAIEKISSRINKERSEYIAELAHFHPIFVSWATTEPELGDLLKRISGAHEKTMLAQNNLIAGYNTGTAMPIKEFISYIDVVQHTLSKRETFQHIYEFSLEELNRRRTEKDKLMSSQTDQSSSGSFVLWKQPSHDEKLEKLGTHIPQLVKKVEMNQDNLECANESLKSDLARWHHEKRQCLKKILLDFVCKQIEYYETTVKAWEGVTEELNPQNCSINTRQTTK